MMRNQDNLIVSNNNIAQITSNSNNMLLMRSLMKKNISRLLFSFSVSTRPSYLQYAQYMNYRQRIRYPDKYDKLKKLRTVYRYNVLQNPELVEEGKEQDKEEQNKDQNKKQEDVKKEKQGLMSRNIFAMVATVFLYLMLKSTEGRPQRKGNQPDPFQFNNLDDIDSVELRTYYGTTDMGKQAHKYEATIVYKNGTKAVSQIVNPNAFLAFLEQKQYGRAEMIPVHFKQSKNLAKSLSDHALQIVLFGLLIYYFVRMRFKLPTQFFFGDFRKGKTVTAANLKVRFDQVAGMNQAKKEIEEIVEFLKNAEEFKNMGAKIPKGALLTGPPGTGKTMLAKACAKQSNASFYSMSGSDFIEMYGGMGASRVRELFSTAKLNSPSIIFIDEIDTIGSKRNSSYGNLQKDSTLNQLLVEMDGFNTDTNVIVMAATNRKQILDDALLRPGRFDRIIQIDLPDLEGRKEIFMVHLQPIKISPEQTMQAVAQRLATLTPGFSGADIANLCNEAAILAARRDGDYVNMLDFEMASERVMAGLEKKNLMTEQTKRIVAYHEAGHAVVGWLSKSGDPVVKVTIVPRSKGSLGFAQYLPSENKLHTKNGLIDRMAIALGGRMAEDIFFGKVTVGAADDLQKVHALGRAMVTRYGMGNKLKDLSLQSDGYINLYSDKTAREIDEELFRFVSIAEGRARDIINQNSDKIKQLAELLIEKETITNKELQQTLGPKLKEDEEQTTLKV